VNSVGNFENRLDDLDDGLRWALDEEDIYQVTSKIEAIRSETELFFKQLPVISSDTQRVRKCFRAYDSLSRQIAESNSFNGDSLSESAKKSLKVVMETLRPGINQLVTEHPLIAEQQMLRTPKLYYACPHLIEERLSQLRKADFLSRFAKNLAWHAADHQLPSPLCRLHPHLVALEKEELEQLGALTHRKIDREEFAHKFGIDRIEELRKSFLKNDKEMDNFLDKGVCFGFSVSLSAQESPDPAMLDWEKVKFLHMLSMLGMRHSDEIEKYQCFQEFERKNPAYLKRYPLLTAFVAKEMGFRELDNLDSELMRKTLFHIISKRTKIDIDDADLLGRVMIERQSLRKEWRTELHITGVLDFLPRSVPVSILKKMGLASLTVVRQDLSIDRPFTELLKDLPEGRFLFLIPGHALFISLQDKMYCDINDTHSITCEPRARRFTTNEEMLAHLQRYLQIKYPKETSFSLVQVKSLPSLRS
jgi:hypothetical protein